MRTNAPTTNQSQKCDWRARRAKCRATTRREHTECLLVYGRRQSKSCRTRNPSVSATSSQGYMSPRGTEHSRNAGQYLGHAPACLLADMYLPCNAEHQSTSTRRNQSQTCAPTHQPQTNHKNVIGARGVLNAAQRRAVNIRNACWSMAADSPNPVARATRL